MTICITVKLGRHKIELFLQCFEDWILLNVNNARVTCKCYFIFLKFITINVSNTNSFSILCFTFNIKFVGTNFPITSTIS